LNTFRQFYENLWEQADSIFYINWFREAQTISVVKEVVSANIIAPGSRLADIGCGNAVYVKDISKLTNSYFVGVDISSVALHQSQKKLVAREQSPCLGLVQGDAAQLPLASASFDSAICTHALEHVPDSSIVINELHRILKSGGYLRVVVPNSTKYMLNIFRPLERRLNGLGHLREYSPTAMRELLSSHQFEIQRMYCTDFFLHWFMFSVEEHLRPLARRCGLSGIIGKLMPQRRVSHLLAIALSYLLFWENRLLFKHSWGMNRCYIAQRLQ
jgi:ubiquinone/menaquinone biosynthesis C-methylase UbiE